jgi:hypothetical protein
MPVANREAAKEEGGHLWDYIAAGFWDRILKDSETMCWLWQGHLDHGYAKISVKGKWCRVQRIVHEEFNGPIPPGMEVHHICQNKSCVSPAHLLALSAEEHRKFHPENGPWSYCSRGHYLSEANTRLESDGKRKCRLCERLRDKAKHKTASASPHNRLKTHCKNGHPFDEANTGRRRDGKGRWCRACHIISKERYRKKHGLPAPRAQRSETFQSPT